MPLPAPNKEEVFLQAMELPTNERPAYLARACGGDRELQAQVESLLRAHDECGGFLEASPPSSSDGNAVHESLGALESSGERIGRYRVLQKYGEGGCGVVYLAEQTEPIVRRVALKVIKLGMDTKEVIGRFAAERQALALMDHPNIAKVLDAGATDTGRPYFVMELVHGVPITKYCDDHDLRVAARLELFVQVCHAIQHAHQKGVVHRDIKPSNILVTLTDDKPVPKVIDFGIAKAMTGRLTNQTLFTAIEQFIGTPAYMSPEQAEMSSLDIDTRSDIYSLGVLLYELLTGRTPFDTTELLKSGLDEMRRQIREVDPQTPSTRLSSLSGEAVSTAAKRRQIVPHKLIHQVRGDLDWIVMKALEKDRTRRYETANALADDINRYLQNKPIRARPPGVAYRLAKLIRRNKLAFGAAAAAGVALVAGLGLFAGLSGSFGSPRPGGSQPHVPPPAKSIAVLPFANLSADKDDSLSDGITEEILSTLAKVPGLRVPARSSSFLFKNRKEDPRRVGEVLQVGALLEGTVRRAGSQLRITADLIDTATGFRLWSETYDREMTNIFAIQDEIARAIVAKLQASMGAAAVLPVNRRRTQNIEAYEWYLRGVFQLETLSESGFASAIGYFQQSLACQPDYASAYSGLAQAYFWQRYFAYAPLGEMLPQLRRNVARALELDPQLVDAQLSDATLKFYVDRDWAGAERAFQRALQLDSGYVHARCFYAFLLAAMRREAAASAEARKAQDLDPLSLTTKVVAGWVHWYNGDFGRAAELADQAATAAPNFHMAHWLAASALFRQGNQAEGVARMEKARGLAPVTDVLSDLGWMYGRAGRMAEARQVLAELEARSRLRFVPAYSLAHVHDGLGDLAQTDSLMRKAIDDREAMVVMLNASADAATRAHPQFREWVRGLGLEGRASTAPARK